MQLRVAITIGQLVGAVWKRASNLMGLALTLEDKARTTLRMNLAACATEDFDAIVGVAAATVGCGCSCRCVRCIRRGESCSC